MKIILMILLSACLSIAKSDYQRYKRVGLPQNMPPGRGPPPLSIGKKWGKPPQKLAPQFGQNRPYRGPPPPPRGTRPIKPQMYPAFNLNQQMQHAQYNNKPQFAQQIAKNPPKTTKNYFKKPVQQHAGGNLPHFPVVSGQIIQFPSEKKVYGKETRVPEKSPFMSSPSIPGNFEYDYHVQTNNIPMSINTIKQVGEKGPIHTIPAPNLTPADKPSNLEFHNSVQHYNQQHEARYEQPQYVSDQSQGHNQYQVTERNEQKHQFSDQINAQTHYTSQPVAHVHVQQQQDQYRAYLEAQNNPQTFQNAQSVFYGQNNLGVNAQENGNQGINVGYIQNQHEQGDDMLFSNSDQYQVVNANYPSKHTQAIQTSYEQQEPQILKKVFQENNSYHEHFQDKVAQDKSSNIKPEYHSFNYDEQAHQAQAKSGLSSGLVTATYSLGSSEPSQINLRSPSIDPLTQAQIVQSYFDTRSGNDVEPDAKPSGTGTVDKTLLGSTFFSSLPNKEAADRLAKLQAAGKINSNLMQIGNINVVSKEKNNNESIESLDNDSKEQSVEYDDDDDYLQDDQNISQSDEESGFGQKTIH